MKMNDTVYRIVEIMFQHVEMNEEVEAIRDEVMNNCQERYHDLVASGMSEDDAVGAVIESLKGMEDVIAPYKRAGSTVHTAEAESSTGDSEAAHGEQDAAFAAHLVEQVEVSLISETVEIEASDDDAFHVRWNGDNDPQIRVALDGGKLCVRRDNTVTERKGKTSVHVDARDGDRHVYVDGDEVLFHDLESSMDGIGKMMESIGRSLSSLFTSGFSSFRSTGVIIAVPAGKRIPVRINTTSGDIEITDVEMRELAINTVSGDVEIELQEDDAPVSMEIRTTSGDVEIDACTDRLVINSTSGDIEAEGRIREINIATVSGDVDVRADAESVTFKTVSGDVDLAFDSDEIRSVNGSTISGDVDVDLPEGVGAIMINTKTRSGDITTRYATNGFGPTVNGAIATMSGDITIR